MRGRNHRFGCPCGLCRGRYKAPSAETIEKARLLWLQGHSFSEIGRRFKRGHSWASSLAVKHGWRTPVDPTVTKRCPDCLGLYQVAGNDYSGHPGCRIAAKASRSPVEPKSPPEHTPQRVAA